MEKGEKIIHYTEYSSINELPVEYKKLMEAAKDAISSSYAPYSNFNVGAAVMMDNGEIITGSNQENAASPSGLCAERVALFYAHHKFPNNAVKAIAVVGSSEGILTPTLTYPCAGCLQVLAESQKRGGIPITIIIGSSSSIQIVESIDALLPFSFIDF